MVRVWPFIVISTFGSSRRLRNQVGCRSSPPYEATTTTLAPSCTGEVSIVVRRLPVLRPVVVSSSTGIPNPRLPSRPSLIRKTARWKPVTIRAPMSLALATDLTVGPQEHLLRDRDRDVAIGAVHGAAQHAATAGVDQRMDVV